MLADEVRFTRSGEPRGYVQPHALEELWFHTGTACNLACPFCLEGSKPGDTSLGQLRLADVVPFVDEALALGVERLAFTGGEPFAVRDILRILGYALERRPCLVLTNGTDPLLRRLSALDAFGARPHPLSLRVSLDYPDAARHEAGRGAGTFAKALEALRALHARGLRVSVARQRGREEDAASVEDAYRQLFAANGLPPELPLVSFPDFAPPGSALAVPEISEDCMTRYHTERSRRGFMCAYSKMVVKQAGRMRVYACTLVDDDPGYDQGGSLREALAARVLLRHYRCYSCFAYGASCSEAP
jgi:molybdenum cofactor biosynthesis enzyme MoaA